jgi:hypothetical protein
MNFLLFLSQSLGQFPPSLLARPQLAHSILSSVAGAGSATRANPIKILKKYFHRFTL